ncbi:WhiB family transcriptional regulator [Streptomyces sp. NPDC058470]|uniref:WhiB family transcriptional regulator n=1 Tax=Streptomyces sp. NPDC058470 TaxID=3346515 RepID=UPI003653BC21
MHAPVRHRAGTDSWVEYAACHDADPETFFPPAGGTDDTEREAAAKQLCARCPVAEPCLREALSHEETTGIWGGLTVRERRELFRVAGTFDAISAALTAFLEDGGRRISPHARERPAYAWLLRRHGWGATRIAGALGLTLSQVQQALRTAEFASVHVRGRTPEVRTPEARMPRACTPRAGAVATDRGRTS